MSKPLNLFFSLQKVDVEKRLVYGVATAEVADQSGEICDYESTKPYYKAWSENFAKVTNGLSLGNIRSMHQNIASGVVKALDFNDDAKEISICAKVVDDDEWKKVLEGVYTGFSHGGRYVKTWRDPANKELTRYTADPVEISLVDMPCLSTAVFSIIKADGTTEIRKFINLTTEQDAMSKKPEGPKQVWLAKDGTHHDTKALATKADADFEAKELAKSTSEDATTIIDDINAKLDKSSGEEKKMEDMTAEEKEEWEKKEKAKKEKAEAEKSAADELAKVEAQKAADLAKAGARHSKGDMAHLEEMHGHMKKMVDCMDGMHKCMKGLGFEGENAMNEGGEDHEKTALADQLQKSNATNEAMKASFATVTESLQAIQKRLQQVEDQPLPAKGAVFAINKNHDLTRTGKSDDEAKRNFSINGLSPEQARALATQS